MKFYLVGGAVRDKLLNLPVKDQDWVVIGGTPEALLAQGFKQVGADFPVFLHPKSKEEYALARQERKKGPGYKGFDCVFSPDVTLEEDLSRRDLTINAMAQDDAGNIVDPYHGQQDLANKTLRHVSEAFVEDPLRVLRVARFAARFHHLGFTIAKETLSLMAAIVKAGEVNNLVAERIWQETARALCERSPEVYFSTLHECTALKVIFPELAKLAGVPQPAQHHPEIDTWVHSQMVLRVATQLSEDIDVRFAALIHDLGKGLTPKQDWPRHIAHEQKGLAAIESLCDRIKTPRDTKDLALLACEFHTHVHQVATLKNQTLLKFFSRADGQRKPDRFLKLLLVCEADARGRTGFTDKPYPQREYLTQILDVLRTLDTKALVDEGYQGAKLGEAIQKKRLSLINETKKRFWGDENNE